MTKLVIALALFTATLLRADEPKNVWHYKREFLEALTRSVPATLARLDKATGQFRAEPWLPGDQAVIYPLAAAWATKDEHNRFYHDSELLNAIMRAGDALIAAQDKNGRWEFQKRDNSKWGLHFDPWVYSRWVRTYSLIRDAMPRERRERWRKALELAYSGIAKTELRVIQNIPSHHAMGLYVAGKAMDHPEWCNQAATYLNRIVQAQNTNGFWTEHYGPVVHYNTVYVDALGTYYTLSHDARVMKALERAAKFHANFTYPNGTDIETADERNPFLDRVEIPNVGFSFSALGRGYLREQWNITRKRGLVPNVDTLASLVLYGEEGEVEAPATNRVFISDDNKAAVIRQGDWCGALSAYVCPVSQSRWIQDRQNLVSVFNSRTGLIVGGGNTKLQPLWSTFTVGQTALLKHRRGDERPNFGEPTGLLHIPTAAKLGDDGTALDLDYGDAKCRVAVEFVDTTTAHITYAVPQVGTTRPVQAHVTLLPAPGSKWRTATGRSGELNSSDLVLSAEETGAWFEHNGWRISVPKSSNLRWPVLPHNPYRKDGRAEVGEGRIVLTLPFSAVVSSQMLTLTVTK
jgi:hypothetical protein